MDLSSLFSLIVAIKPLETWEKPKRHKIVSLWPTCKKAYSVGKNVNAYIIRLCVCVDKVFFRRALFYMTSDRRSILSSQDVRE